MEILLIYEALQQREVGYTLMQNLASHVLKTGSIKQGTYLDQVFLPTIAQLYAQNEPFIEPDYMGPHARQPVNFYQ
jgi:hypothetical protein